MKLKNDMKIILNFFPVAERIFFFPWVWKHDEFEVSQHFLHVLRTIVNS